MLGPRIRDVEAFWYKTEIKIIYFVPLCLIMFDRTAYPDPRVLIFKTRKTTSFLFLRLDAVFLYYVITQGICNKFIEMKISVECMV